MSTRIRASTRAVAALALVIAIALAAAGCGSSKKSSSSSSSASGAASGGTSAAQVSHPKTKFVLHAGLAFGAFHHWIYKPARAGDFSHPLSHKLAVIRAGLAGVFVYRELKLALADAQASPTLSKLVAPITALQNKVNGLASGIKSGHPDTSAITQSNDSISSIKQQAAGAGQPISDIVPSHP